VLAAEWCGIEEVPIVFVDKYGTVKDAQINSDVQFEIHSRIDYTSIVKDAEDEEFFEFILHKQRTGLFSKMNWIKSDYTHEKDEFDRVTKLYKIPPTTLENNYKPSTPQPLKKSTWKDIKNTDSWNVKTIQEVADISKKQGKNYRKIAVEMLTSKKTFAPIVAKKKNEYYLIAGNVRLMLSRVLDIEPKVCIVDI
jgi:hypothetical protein